jgi:hypothetical protein
VIRDLVADSRAFAQQQKPKYRPEPAPRGPLEPRKLGPPEGIEIIDRMMDAQDKRDLAEEVARRLRGG